MMLGRLLRPAAHRRMPFAASAALRSFSGEAKQPSFTPPEEPIKRDMEAESEDYVDFEPPPLMRQHKTLLDATTYFGDQNTPHDDIGSIDLWSVGKKITETDEYEAMNVPVEDELSFEEKALERARDRRAGLTKMPRIPVLPWGIAEEDIEAYPPIQRGLHLARLSALRLHFPRLKKEHEAAIAHVPRDLDQLDLTITEADCIEGGDGKGGKIDPRWMNELLIQWREQLKMQGNWRDLDKERFLLKAKEKFIKLTDTRGHVWEWPARTDLMQ